MIHGGSIGRAIERLEDLRFVRGRGCYVDDLHPPGLLHAVVLRSPLAHGLIRSLDVRPALARAGVHGAFTAADIGTPVPRIPMRLDPLASLEAFTQPVIAEGKVRYVGEPLALIVAESAAQAEDALEAVQLEIDPLPCVGRADARGPQRLFESAPDNVALTLEAVRGDADAAFAAAPYVRRERFSVQRHSAMTLEPRGLLATWDPVRTALTVYGASKVAHANRRFLARMIGLEERAIELVENDVGGAFGVRGEFYPEDFLIPFAARALGRPVKWIEDRRENLMAANHARDAHCELEIACTREGRIIGLRGEAVTDIGAYMRTNGVTPSRNIAQVCSGPYRIENIRVGVTLLLTNKTPVGTYRGPGRFETDFFRERLFDIAAAEMGIDRVEFRRRNLIAEADMPYALAELKPYSGRTACDSGDYGGSLERCLNEFDWTGKQALNGQCIAGRYHGIGLGCYIEGGGSGPRESARLVLETDGRVSVYVGSSSVGQGIETSLAQIAADALGLPFEGIRAVYHGSTAHVREGFGAYSSRCVVQGGSAIVLAAGELLKRLSAEAARQLGCSEQQLSRQPGGWQSAAGRSIGWKTLGQSAPFEAEATFSSQARTYSYGAHAAHVAVDSRTGAIEVLDYVAVEDVGRVINPLILHGQTQGAIVQGMGGVFLEQLVYDAEGQLLTGSFADYLLPTASGIPPMTIVATGDKPSPHNPLGAKGAGEGGIIAVGGVLANAVSAALARFGVQANDLPLSPARIWALINAQRPLGPDPEQP